MQLPLPSSHRKGEVGESSTTGKEAAISSGSLAFSPPTKEYALKLDELGSIERSSSGDTPHAVGNPTGQPWYEALQGLVVGPATASFRMLPARSPEGQSSDSLAWLWSASTPMPSGQEARTAGCAGTCGTLRHTYLQLTSLALLDALCAVDLTHPETPLVKFTQCLKVRLSYTPPTRLHDANV